MKKWYTSKTLWIAFLVFVAAVVNLTGIIKLDVDPQASWIAVALSVIQVILRLVTKGPVTLGDGS